MTKWKADETEFPVSITHNTKRHTSYCYIPKPVLAFLGNPNGLKFIIRDGQVVVTRPD